MVRAPGRPQSLQGTPPQLHGPAPVLSQPPARKVGEYAATAVPSQEAAGGGRAILPRAWTTAGG